MAETAGYTGAIYYQKGRYSGAMVWLSSAGAMEITIASISTPYNSVASYGFAAGDTIGVTGTDGTSNDGSYTIDSISASVMTLVSAGSTNASEQGLMVSRPGTAIAGFYNWTVTYGCDAHDVTDFANSGDRTYVPGQKAWTATATKRYSDASSNAAWVGDGYARNIRFFLNYNAAPSSTDSYYYEGSAFVTATDTTTDVNAAIEQTVNFQGTGALTLVKRSTAW